MAFITILIAAWEGLTQAVVSSWIPNEIVGGGGGGGFDEISNGSEVARSSAGSCRVLTTLHQDLWPGKLRPRSSLTIMILGLSLMDEHYDMGLGVHSHINENQKTS